MTRLAAVIPSAGLSSRMGSFKPLLPLGSGTVLSRCIEVFRQNGVARIIVVTGKRAEEVASAARRAGAVAVHNADYEQGMFSSVLTGIRALDPTISGFFLLPVDIPLVRVETVTRLIQAFSESDASVFYPRFQGQRGHPPLISSSLIPHILTHDGQGGLRALLDTFESGAHDLVVTDAGSLRDLDHPADYEFAMKRVGQEYPFAEEWEQLWDVYGVSQDIREHCAAVARVAKILCLRFNETCTPHALLNPALATGAAMVHDIGKGRKHHDAVGAWRLLEHGFTDAAQIVREHSDLSLGERDNMTEKEIVFLADKLVQGSSPVRLNARYEAKLMLFGDRPEARKAIRARQERANAVRARLERVIGVDVETLAFEGGG
ncbi:DVU_1551 family NTP transferase [Pseudodesulfovibrio piezophilus]|uniref:Metal dependent phosphohydrolase n=1 Tax=Pseudodesulfovibrio piezophilus (strain DSM 21447 / JCM 15486 / C1TLV30) TaxID=1322246 RepID=M1WK74_PSEP2|nr:NTP transferase domain-containing protein [Pseudodesulfovibrio piezophilus]CCH49106.1 Metal dependent phosphohydrolase [Pseudodesulfovibrio piezophilus C1TLV30]